MCDVSTFRRFAPPTLKTAERKTPELKTPELKTHTAEDKGQIKKHENTKNVHRKVLKMRPPRGQVEPLGGLGPPRPDFGASGVDLEPRGTILGPMLSTKFDLKKS